MTLSRLSFDWEGKTFYFVRWNSFEHEEYKITKRGRENGLYAHQIMEEIQKAKKSFRYIPIISLDKEKARLYTIYPANSYWDIYSQIRKGDYILLE